MVCDILTMHPTLLIRLPSVPPKWLRLFKNKHVIKELKTLFKWQHRAKLKFLFVVKGTLMNSLHHIRDRVPRRCFAGLSKLDFENLLFINFSTFFPLAKSQSDSGSRDFRLTRASLKATVRLLCRSSILLGIQGSPYSITRDLYLIHTNTLTLPDEPMHPRTAFSFTDISHKGENGIVRKQRGMSRQIPPLCSGPTSLFKSKTKEYFK
jgi:hypothetical protein